MASPDRTLTESTIRQLISDMEVSLQSLERGVDETYRLWDGEAADQFTASVVEQLIEGYALLDEMRAAVAAPPWGCAAV